MKFSVHINVMPLKELLDPQGKTVEKNLPKIHIEGVSNVRVGKHIQMVVEADNESEAKVKVEQACKKVLVNLIVESYDFTIAPVPS